ncbi:UPF0223 family protein [Leuconostoc sp. MS02]|uniref:UPF0223 family protein n=1 Tax=Leuconostoc aquikimchii TaxID=3236804 RepID=A0ABV3S366_9LACO
MSENYILPIDGNWTVDDIVKISNLVDSVLEVYEAGVPKSKLLARYNEFRDVLPAKSEQKRFDKDFERQTGRSIYKTLKLAQSTTKDKVRG